MSLTISPERIVEESGSPLLAAAEEWRRRPLGEVATIVNGCAFKSKDFVNEGGKPLIRIRDIFNESTAVGYVGAFDDRYLVHPGDLLVGMDGDFNSARWAGPEALLNQRVCRVAPDADLMDLDFLTALLPGYLKAIHELTSSTTVTHLSSKDVALLPIPVPPLDEQRRIAKAVGIVDERKSKTASHLASASHALARFRQSVLASACAGRLTEDWRESNPSDSASPLVEGIRDALRLRLGSRFKAPQISTRDEKLPDGWCLATVGELVQVATGATPLRTRSDYFGGKIPWITSGAANGDVISESKEFITERALKETNAKVFPAGTLVVAMYGEGQTRGRVAELGIAAATNQALAALVFDEQSAPLRPYLYLFFQENYERIRQLSFGGVQPNLSLGVIKETQVAIPPLPEISEIIRRVDTLMNLADRLQARIDTASPLVDQSLQAVLAKAFRGDLVG